MRTTLRERKKKRQERGKEIEQVEGLRRRVRRESNVGYTARKHVCGEVDGGVDE